jgi:hypothetical protein
MLSAVCPLQRGEALMMNDSTDSDSTETMTTEERVTITLHDYPVSITEDERETGLEALEDAISQLPDVNIAPADITVRVGHHYVQIGDNCPRCARLGNSSLRSLTGQRAVGSENERRFRVQS